MTPHAIWSSLASVTPEWLAAAVLLNAAALMLRGLAWLVLLRAALPGARVGAAGVLRATMIGVMGSALVPGRVGEPARAWLIARRHGALATVLGTMVAQTLVNLAALALLAAAPSPARARSAPGLARSPPSRRCPWASRWRWPAGARSRAPPRARSGCRARAAGLCARSTRYAPGSWRSGPGGGAR
jgi:hypothetical protein